jgi:hypothetical protein
MNTALSPSMGVAPMLWDDARQDQPDDRNEPLQIGRFSRSANLCR